MEPSAIQEGTIVDRYTVEAVLGEGGMAIVYRVRHNVLGTVHALKILTMSSRQIRDRLRQEGQFQAKLQHPNVVAVTDVIDLGGAPGLIMEYIDGPSLDGLIRQGPLTVAQVDELAGGIFAGVAEAHRQGFVHRDLKPANVLIKVTERGIVPKVADFGLAKALGGGSDPGQARTRTGSTMGTPHYMSPEQVRDAKNVGARSDLFALGAILYEMACARRAFEGNDLLDIFNAIATGHYRPVREWVPELPERMEVAINAALQTSPEARPESVEALAALWYAGERLGVPVTSMGSFDLSTLSLPKIALPMVALPMVALPETGTIGPTDPGTPAPPPVTPPMATGEATWAAGTLQGTLDEDAAPVRSSPPVPPISLPGGRAVWAVGLGGGVFAVLFVAAMSLFLVTGGLLWVWSGAGPMEVAAAPPLEHVRGVPSAGGAAVAEGGAPADAAQGGEMGEGKVPVPVASNPVVKTPIQTATGDAPAPASKEPVVVAEGEVVSGEEGEGEGEDAVAVVDTEIDPGETPASPVSGAPALSGAPPDEVAQPRGRVELTQFLASSDPEERKRGIDNLVKRQDDDALRLMDRMVREEKDSSVRRYAWLAVLARYNDRNGNVDLLENTIVWQMGHMPSRDAVEAVKAFADLGSNPLKMRGAIGHSSREVRLAVIPALREVAARADDTVDYPTLVAPLLEDEDEDVKRKAQALSNL